MFQLILGLIILALVGVYLWLKRSETGPGKLGPGSGHHSEANLPAVSEDVNLPMNPPATNEQPDKNPSQQ